MSPVISKLPDLLINQIAAGEVVENPSSCIKELVENSIDAGASFIEIHIKSGGFVSISIIDNGHGIKESDVLLAFERHTTSKIQKLEDLLSHEKMGFRGEALASIASCSKVTLKTSTVDGSGVICELEGGVKTSFSKASLKKGTSIEIKELFYNTPARKKFQKSQSASTSEIEKLITFLILAHPKISFRFKCDNQIRIDAPIDKDLDFKKAFKKRIYDMFQDIDVDKGQFLDISDPICSITGFLAPFEATSHTRKNQYFIVNQRPVEAFNLSYAMTEALRTFLPEKRFFQGVFHLNIDPKWVDINIHPQKKEVKFAEEAYIKDLLKRLVTPQMPSLKSQAKSSMPLPTFNYDFSLPQAKKEDITPSFTPHYDYKKVIGYYPPYLLIDAKELVDLFSKEGLVLFDVKKAYLTLSLHQFFSENKFIESQGLLIPESLPLSKDQKNTALEYRTHFRMIGFDLDDSSMLTSYPSELSLEEAKKLFVLCLENKESRQEEFVLFAFKKISETKLFSFQDAQKLLNNILKLSDHSMCFALISDSKLKELFYAGHQS
jgi:DNA mismatch repair protein MutL